MTKDNDDQESIARFYTDSDPAPVFGVRGFLFKIKTDLAALFAIMDQYNLRTFIDKMRSGEERIGKPLSPTPDCFSLSLMSVFFFSCKDTIRRHIRHYELGVCGWQPVHGYKQFSQDW